jgi:hypothetical protein
MVFLLKKKKKKPKNVKLAQILQILKQIQFFWKFRESCKNNLRVKSFASS